MRITTTAARESKPEAERGGTGHKTAETQIRQKQPTQAEKGTKAAAAALVFDNSLGSSKNRIDGLAASSVPMVSSFNWPGLRPAYFSAQKRKRNVTKKTCQSTQPQPPIARHSHLHCAACLLTISNDAICERSEFENVNDFLDESTSLLFGHRTRKTERRREQQGFANRSQRHVHVALLDVA
jgi:hypothetical protein